MTSQWIMALDPGKMSGVALMSYDGVSRVHVAYSDEFDEHDTGDWMAQFMADYRPGELTVVVENFLITKKTAEITEAPWSLRLIGVASYLAHVNGLSEPTLQTPAAAKSFCPNPRLRAIGLWHKGGAGHANDALRHGALYLHRRRGWNHPGLLTTNAGETA